MKKLLFTVIIMSLLVSGLVAQESRVNNAFMTTPISQQISESPATLESANRGEVVFASGFEGTTGTNLPTGWTSIPSTGTAGVVRWATSSGDIQDGTLTPYEGTRFAYIRYNMAAVHDAWMITPAFTLTAGQQYTVEFYLQALGYGAVMEELTLYLGTEATATGMTSGTMLWQDLQIGGQYSVWTRIAIVHTPAETGSYRLGFHNTSDDAYFTAVDAISVSVLDNNDLTISSVYPYSQVPKNQFLLSPLTGRVTNEGALAQTGISVQATLNGTSVGSDSHPSLEPSSTYNFSITNIDTPIIEGTNTLTYTVTQTETDDNPSNNTVTNTFIGTDNLFATDTGTFTTYYYGNAITRIGNIYTFTKITDICQILSYHYNGVSNATSYSVAIHEVTGANTIATEALYLQTGIPKTATTAWFTHNLTSPLSVPAGSYFVSVTGLDTNLLGDGNAVGRNGYSVSTTGTTLTPITTTLCLRLMVDLNMNDLMVVPNVPPFTQIPASQTIGMPFPTSLSGKADNIGLATQTNIVLSASFNGVPLGSSNPIPSLAPLSISTDMTISVTAGQSYPATPGTYNFTYTVTQTEIDQNPTNNTMNIPVVIGNIYAIDGIETPSNGVGNNSSAIQLGNIFTIYNPTILTDVMVGFINNATLNGANFNVVMYRAESTSAVVNNTAIFSVTAQRPAYGIITVEVPNTLVMPGMYYLAIHQTSTSNIGAAWDNRPGVVRMYTKSPTGTVLSAQPNFGAGLVRMVTQDVPSEPVLVISPVNGRDFGLLEINATAPTQVFTITNMGANNLIINDVTIDGSDAFVISEIYDNDDLSLGQSTTFTIAFNTSLAGTYNANLVISTNISTTDYTYPLAGEVVDPTIVSLPHNESFETTTGSALPLGWSTTITSAGNSAGIITQTSTNPAVQDGVRHLRMSTGTGTNANGANTVVMATTPVIANITHTRVTFYARSSNASQVLLVGTIDQNNEWSELETINLSNSAWELQTISLADAEGTRLAFRHGRGAVSGQSQRYIYIDNITIEYENNTHTLITVANVNDSLIGTLVGIQYLDLVNRNAWPVDPADPDMVLVSDGTGEIYLKVPAHLYGYNVSFPADFVGILGREVDDYYLLLRDENDIYQNGTLPVVLSSFTAQVLSDDTVKISWVTESESSIRGFHVFRGETEDISTAERITPSLIEGTNTSSTQKYEIIDTEVLANHGYYYWLQIVNNDGSNTIVQNPMYVFITEQPELPEIIETRLHAMYPNPVRASQNSHFTLDVKTDETASLRIYNIKGQLVREFSQIKTGNQNIVWDNRDHQNRPVATGIYFYQVQSPSYSAIKKMVIIK